MRQKIAAQINIWGKNIRQNMEIELNIYISKIP
jgi:hypothetical protein